MINIQLVLVVGNLNEEGRFDIYDEYDMTIADYKSDVHCDNINDLLRKHWNCISRYENLAELRLKIDGIDHDGFLVASFRQTKVKTKSGSKIRWVVID